MKIPKCLSILAHLLAVSTMDPKQRRTFIDKVLEGRPKCSVHDIPNKEVNQFLHPLLKRKGGANFLKELIHRSSGSRKHNEITTIIQDAMKGFPPYLVKVIGDFVVGLKIPSLDVNTKDPRSGMTLLLAAVSKKKNRE